MELQQIRYVLAVRRHGSFSRAADECGISQPALTVAVRKLASGWNTSMASPTWTGSPASCAKP